METSFPDGLAKRHGNARSRSGGTLRLLPLAGLAAIAAVGLSGLLGGGGPTTVETSSGATKLSVETPHILRSGEYFQRRIEVVAGVPTTDLSIAVGKDLLNGFTVNSTVPEPESQSFEHGSYVLSFGAVDAGQRIVLQSQLQTNPNKFGRAAGEIVVRDGDTELARLPLSIMVLP